MTPELNGALSMLVYALAFVAFVVGFRMIYEFFA
jgi:hypothetical protein